jgi:flagellum-specific ATP synthase
MITAVAIKAMFEAIHSVNALGIAAVKPVAVGKVTRVVGLSIEAKGINVVLGGRCAVERPDNGSFEAEVVGFDGDKTFLMPLHRVDVLRPGAKVTPLSAGIKVPAGLHLLGRVLDGTGKPLDDKGAITHSDTVSFHPIAINPLRRMPISEPLDIGVRSINAALSIGRGQRVGLFAGSGVGKSVLLGMITRFTEADVVVVALVGERGREVREFIENNLGAAGMAKSVVVASPADDTPVMRLRAGLYASRLCEDFRDQGLKTLLLFDSLTRYAQAQREVALAAGEPPATRGYPPSVFARLPQLVERAGNGTGNGGSVTAIYTVLTEGDDFNDPVADSARAILDGHIVLSRHLASEGVYPAVDVRASISRSMNAIVDQQQLDAANRLKLLISRYEESRDLINVGAYIAGVDTITDEAIAKQPLIRDFLSQTLLEHADYPHSRAALQQLLQQDAATPANIAMQTAGVNNSAATEVDANAIQQPV